MAGWKQCFVTYKCSREYPLADEEKLKVNYWLIYQADSLNWVNFNAYIADFDSYPCFCIALGQKQLYSTDFRSSLIHLEHLQKHLLEYAHD